MRENFVYWLVIISSIFLYSFKLNLTPVHLNQDEAMFALNAYSISQNGHDFYGNKFPFYFWHLDSFWATPLIVYWSSIFLKFLPLSEATIRIPGVVLAIINIGLLMYLSKLIFKKRYLAVVSGVFLAFTPAFFINSRILLDNTYPIFFVLLWLILLLKKSYLLSGLILGMGVHSYHAAKIYMPIYLLMTIGYLLLGQSKEKISKVSKSLIGFFVPLLLFLPWLKNHPDTLLNQVSYAKSIDSSLGSNFFENYLKYFDPSFLFSYGDSSLIHSTGKVGVFLLPMFVFLVFGIVKVLKDRENIFGKLLLFSFLAYPIAPSIINDPYRISRALVLIPFAVLLSTFGIQHLWESKDKILKHSVVFLVCTSTFLFAVFLYDYFGNYRLRSPHLFNNNIGGVFESMLRSTTIRPVKNIYIDNSIFMGSFYFEFYKKKLNIHVDSVNYINLNEDILLKLQPGSIVATPQKFKNLGMFEIIETIREPNGDESYYVYWRDK